jgi:CDGSH-type Zn-finger protein
VTIRVRCVPRGPLVLERDAPGGDALEVLAPDGSPLDVAHMRRIRLCRCGASGHKPLCDGAHNRVAFESRTDRDAEGEGESDTPREG